jgi:small neutral amino acid transporter SnatA (MarC family)
MSGLLLAVAWLAVVNPPRTRHGLPDAARGRQPALVIGAALALAVLAGLAAGSGPLLEALEITPETFRIAAGLVVLVGGLRSYVWETPHDEPVPDGTKAALWPIAFPRLITPAAVLLAVSAGSREGVGATALAAGVALVVAVAAGPVRTDSDAGRVLVALGRVLAVLAVAAGVFLMVDGIRDV